jgi:hypothetical protein
MSVLSALLYIRVQGSKAQEGAAATADNSIAPPVPTATATTLKSQTTSHLSRHPGEAGAAAGRTGRAGGRTGMPLRRGTPAAPAASRHLHPP